ncbi:DUF2523 family protein [Stenotrophomonas maltophilia]|jgi:hypothetical protein|uniref:DUF2523 family protein n=1 Tax=Stenotrophomonas maltophilia TaxID=40324 RepID=UPI00131249B8|nr:DUF2523 family protein [Stenotrophomonas maltophilia]MCF3458649.1 DUF2523 domain-containing protein [Stenotrophomonas maltophilia]MCF3515141.1 DUF2523 domain-containing protein [Stenotrophomonas maltophilia]MCU1188606.1 DUF2523 domain-containing protein [Stenotrophomonas maltophilia]
MSMIWEWITRGVNLVWTVLFGGIGRIVTKTLSTAGITLVSVNQLLPVLKTTIANYVGSLPDTAHNFLGAVGFDVFMTMILSALSVRFAFKLIPMSTAQAQQLGVTKE